MWPEMSNSLCAVLGVILCSMAVKLIDDYLDREIDFRAGRRNWAEKLGKGTIVYSVLLLAFAAALDTKIVVPLFLASYIVGMFSSLTQRLPSSLSGWQESLLIFFLGILFFGWQAISFSVFFVSAVQLFDDCIDYRLDRIGGHRNFAHRLGVLECIIVAMLSLLSAWLVNDQYITPALIGTGLVYAASFRCQEVKLWSSKC